MKLLHILATAAALASAPCSTVSAAECTLDDLDGTGPPRSFSEACPRLFGEGNCSLFYTDLNSINETRLAGLKPCGEQKCVDEFTKDIVFFQDCEIWGTNIRALFKTILQVCTKFSQGPVTVADFNAIFYDLIANTSTEFKMVMEGLDPEVHDDVAKYMAEHGNSTDPPTAPTTAPTLPVPTSSVVPSSTPAPTSNAVGGSGAGALAAAGVTLAFAAIHY